MLAWLLIACIVFMFIYTDIDITGDRVIISGYKTKYFYVSQGQSKKMFEKMKKDMSAMKNNIEDLNKNVEKILKKF